MWALSLLINALAMKGNRGSSCHLKKHPPTKEITSTSLLGEERELGISTKGVYLLLS